MINSTEFIVLIDSSPGCPSTYRGSKVISEFSLQMDIKGGVTNFRRRILSIEISEITDG